MRTVGTTIVDVNKHPLKPAQKDVEYFLQKMYEDDPNRPFTLRMSNVARPLCQLQMDKARIKDTQVVEDDWNFPLRMMYGSIIEGLTVSILRHSGIKIDEEQTPVKLCIADTIISGTLDLVIDGRVWDIKSASPISFRDKFASYETLKREDHLGYLGQLYGYSKARGLPAGGWIVIDKSSGEIKVLAAPDEQKAEFDEQLSIIENNVKIVGSGEAFKRSFSDKDETYKKKLTGNKVLESPCIFCKHRYNCWPGLQHLPSFMSTAFDKPYKYYTKVTNENTIG